MIGTALIALLQVGSPLGSQIPVQSGVSVRPETVTVGDPFIVTVRVRVERGATIAFPAAPDSGGSVEAVDPRAVRSSPDTGATEQTARYRLVAWDTGGQPARLGDVVVTFRGRDRALSLGDARVYVRSVLPRDTTLHRPKPARGILESPRPWWRWLLAALAAAALLGILIWWWRRRRGRKRDEPRIDALAFAEREFTRIEALGLVEAGERGRFVALMTEVLRHYLSARVDAALPSLTSTELVELLKGNRHVPGGQLAGLLAETDLIKFARRAVSAERAREIGREARRIVRDVERAREAETSAAREKAA